MKRPDQGEANRLTANHGTCGRYGLISHKSGKLLQSHIYALWISSMSHNSVKCNLPVLGTSCS